MIITPFRKLKKIKKINFASSLPFNFLQLRIMRVNGNLIAFRYPFIHYRGFPKFYNRSGGLLSPVN